MVSGNNGSVSAGDLVRSLLTDESPNRLFRCLARGGKYQTDDQLNVNGAKVFKRKFSGICGKRIRSENDTLDFIIEQGLAESNESAQNFIKSLEGREIRYDFGRTFVLEPMVSADKGKGYRLRINDYIGAIVDAIDMM